jgi:transcriptional regulator with XRE-family HTH domain
MEKTYIEEATSTPEGMRRFQRERAVESVTTLICDLMDEQEVSRSQLADRLGKTRGWVTQLLDGERNKTVRTLSDVFCALGHSLEFSRKPLHQAFADSGLVRVAEFTLDHQGSLTAATTVTEAARDVAYN